MAGGGGRCRRAGARKKKEGVFIGGAACRGSFARPSPSTEATVWAKGAGVVGGVASQWWPRRADAVAYERAAWHRPMARCVSQHLGTQCPRSPPSDYRVAEESRRACACVRRRRPTRRGAASRVAHALAPNRSKCPCLTQFFSKFCN
jgi:hypothetical protein